MNEAAGNEAAGNEAARLAAVLGRENAALAALDFGAIGALAEEKARALEVLPVAADTPEWRALALAAAENRRLLARAIAVQRRVIAIVARAVAPGAGAYGAPGRPAAGRAEARLIRARV